MCFIYNVDWSIYKKNDSYLNIFIENNYDVLQ